MKSIQKAIKLLSQLIAIALRNPHRLSHVLGTALQAASEVSDRELDLLSMPEISHEALLPSKRTRIQLEVFPSVGSSISLLESLCLVLLLRKTAARNIFEFGTYKGVSISQLALNACENARIMTLDLPESDSQTAFAIPDAADLAIANESGKGSLVPPDLASRIQFVKCDSARFDPAPFAGQFDFVFIDGAHNTDYVRNDSEKAWTLLRSGGIAVWHDYRINDPDVVRYLLKSSFQPRRLTGTTFAVAIKP